MIHSLLIGLAGGMRSMTPLAAVALAAQNNALPPDTGAPRFLHHPAVAAGAAAMAVAELLGDKWDKAPDRIVPPGMAARLVTGAIAGAALAPRSHQAAGAVVGAIAAVASSYITWSLRIATMRRYGQVPTGVVEDAAMLALTAATVASARNEGLKQVAVLGHA